MLKAINPKKLFLIDSLGALLTAIMLGFVLVRFENSFGMPKKELYTLSSIAWIFFICSGLCFLGNSGKWRLFMKFIAFANLMYCCFTIGLIVYFYKQLTILDFLYFLGEIILIICLAFMELKTASN